MYNRSMSFAVAGVAGGAVSTAASAPSPLYPTYQQLWQLSSFTLTVIFTVYVFALLAALLTFGSLSDRVGRRPVASAALGLLAAGMALFATAGGPVGLMVARTVQGLAVGSATSTTTAMILDTAPNPRIGSVISSAAPPLGIAVGAVLTGTLVEFAPAPRQLVFWVLAATFAVLAALVWSVPEPGRSESAAQQPMSRKLWSGLKLPVDVRPTFVALIPSLVATWALAGLYLSLGSSLLHTVLGVRSPLATSAVLAVFFLAGMSGTVVSAILPPRRGEWFGYATLPLGVVTTIAALAMNVLPLYVIGSIIAGGGFGSMFRAAVDTLGDKGPVEHRGQVFTTMYVVSYLAFSLPVLVAGFAAGRFGLEATAIGYGGFELALVVVAMAAAVNATRSDVAKTAVPSAASSLTSRTFSTPRHTTHFLECGPADGPLIVFLHGWPGIGLMWRAQMCAFAAEGWRCVAPDLRGYGGSAAPDAEGAYAIEEIVTDMAELHDHLGGAAAIWVGHDWGSIVVGSLASHEPERCRGVVLTSWAYFPDANSLASLVPLVDRSIYPAETYPDGQWDYYRYYTTHFDSAVADLEADCAASLASIYRRGDPASVGTISPSALVTRRGGRFGAEHRAPATEPDPTIWPRADFDVLVESFRNHGFRPPCAWYLNDEANIAYAREAPDGGRLSQPVLFVNGEFDVICTITGNRQGDPMRAACKDLTVVSMPAGHWIPLERDTELVGVIGNWLRTKSLRHPDISG